MNPENVYPWTLQQQPKINISQKKHKKTKSSDFSISIYFKIQKWNKNYPCEQLFLNTSYNVEKESDVKSTSQNDLPVQAHTPILPSLSNSQSWI